MQVATPSRVTDKQIELEANIRMIIEFRNLVFCYQTEKFFRVTHAYLEAMQAELSSLREEVKN